MSQRPSRPLVVLVLLGIAINLSGVSLALAADGSVAGTVSADGGPMPAGTVVKATPLTGGSPYTATIGADGAYEIPQLPEGPYKFELVGPDGAVLASGVNRLLRAALNQVNLTVMIIPVETTTTPSTGEQVAEPEVQKTPATTTSTAAKAGMSTAKKWGIVAVVVGAVGVGYLIADDDDPKGSPSGP